MLFIIPNLVASFKKELFYPLKSDNIIVLFILWKGMVIMMSNYKSFSELKRLARVQLQGKYGTLIGALLIQELLVFFASGLPAALLPVQIRSVILCIILCLLSFSLLPGFYRQESASCI